MTITLPWWIVPFLVALFGMGVLVLILSIAVAIAFTAGHLLS